MIIARVYSLDDGGASLVELDSGEHVRVAVAPEDLTLADVAAAYVAPTPAHALEGQALTWPVAMLSGAAVYLKHAGEVVGVVDLATVLARRAELAGLDVDEIQVTLGRKIGAVQTNASVRLLANGVAVGGAERTGQTPAEQQFFGAVE